MSQLPTYNVTGVVKNTSGETLPLANVYVSDANGAILGGAFAKGTTADINGKYTLTDVAKLQYITASYVGKRQTKQVLGDKIDFTINTGFTLGEVEIIGKKRKIWPWIIGALLTITIAYAGRKYFKK